MENRIVWKMVAENYSPIAMRLLEKNLHFLNDDFDNDQFDYLVSNPYAMDIIEKNSDRVNFSLLCNNKTERAIHMIEEYIDDMEDTDNILDLEYLSGNPFAMDIIEKNLDKINWRELSSNTSRKAIKFLKII